MIYNQTKYNNKWNTMKLNELGTFARGKSKHRPRNDKKLFEGGGYPLVQTGEIKEANLYVNKHNAEYNEFGLSQSKMWKKDTLCITIAANIAETAILSYPMCFPDSVVGFNADKEVSSELFMHYIFTYIKQAIQKSASGSIQDNINIDYLEHLDFKIPNKNVQDKIINVLYNIDKKIEINNKVIEKLESLSQTIYNYWFIQYEFPNEDGKPYKSSCGKVVWNEELKKEVPIGWKVKKINEIVDMVSGYAFSTNEYDDLGEYKLYTIKNVQDGKIISTVDNRINEMPINMPKECELQINDILMSLTGNVGRIGLVYEEKVLLNQRLLKLIPKYNDISYIYLLFRNDFMKSKLEKISTGTSQKNLSPIDLGNVKIVAPNELILNKFNNICNSVVYRITENLRENEELMRLRDFLLPLLMNGQVGFKN